MVVKSVLWKENRVVLFLPVNGEKQSGESFIQRWRRSAVYQLDMANEGHS